MLCTCTCHAVSHFGGEAEQGILLSSQCVLVYMLLVCPYVRVTLIFCSVRDCMLVLEIISGLGIDLEKQ